MNLDQRDVEFLTVIGQIDHLGLVVLCALALHFPEPVKTARLARLTKTGDIRKTLQPALDACEICGYATRTGSPRYESWHITDIGRSILNRLIASTAASTRLLPRQPALPFNLDSEESSGALSALGDPVMSKPLIGENLSPARSSSSIKIDLNSIDRSIIEEEETERISAERWCDAHRITGDKRRAILSDPFCTADRLEAWLREWTRLGQTAKGEPFRSKFGPLNYAVACCLNHDDPPALADDEQENLSAPPISENEQPVIIVKPWPRASEWWQATKGELSLEMNRATFDTWVKPTFVVDVERDAGGIGGVYVIGCPNQYSVDWLRDRLASTVNRILTGIHSPGADHLIWTARYVTGRFIEESAP